MAVSYQASTAFQKVAELFGKKTVPFENIKGKTTVPESYIGSWVLLERADRRISIAEIASTQVTLGDLKFPLGAIALREDIFPYAVEMAMTAVREYQYVQEMRREIPPGEIFGAHLPEVTINGTTYYRDDVRKEFRSKGDTDQRISFEPEQRISFADYEQKYFGGQRWLRAQFSGNVASIESSRRETYETTNQENALQAIGFWVLNGVLKPGAGHETEPRRFGRGEEINELMVTKVQMEITVRGTPHQTIQTEDAPKALRAIRSWVKGGTLKG